MMVLFRGQYDTTTDELQRDLPKALNQLAVRLRANP